MAASDRVLGASLLLFSFAVFAYYTLWTIAMPFVDEGHPLQGFFPDRIYAIRVPVALLVFGLATIGGFISLVLIKSKAKKAAK
ncbi:dolichol phosphate-mannose biosynthesis regulatory, partial [Ramicandelaber brevisporus]